MTDESPEAPQVELVHVETKPKAIQRAKTVEDLETEIFLGAGEAMQDVVKYCADWPVTDKDGQQAMFEHWRDTLGPERANRIRNTVEAAWKGKKDAPVWLAIEQAIFVSGVKARAMKSGGQNTMNVQIVQMSAPMPNFQRKRIEE